MINRWRFIPFVIPALLTIIVLACTGGGTSDSGGGIDIGNPTKITVSDMLNRPVANASVKVIPAGSWLDNIFGGRTVIVDSGTTDQSGIFRCDSCANGTFNLQIDHSTGGAFVQEYRAGDAGITGNITIHDYGTVTGTVTSSSGIPAAVRLSGTSYSVPVGADGTYSFPRVAEGVRIPVIMAADSHWTSSTAISVIRAATAVSHSRVSFSSLLLDDFEDSTATQRIGRFLVNSLIYTAHVDLDSVAAFYRIVAGGSDRGNVLEGTLLTRGAWALIGFALGRKPDGDSLWDISAASGLSFFARGTGTLNISFESDSIDKMGLFKHYSADVTLSAQWQKTTIPFDSLKFKDDLNTVPNITWKASARSIKRIEFNALENDTVRLWLDDLELDGVDFSAIY